MAKWTDELVVELTKRVETAEKTEDGKILYSEAERIADELALTTRQVTGKLRSLEVPTQTKAEATAKAPAKYTDEEVELIRKMVDSPKEYFIEDIAEKLGKEVKSVRGKLLAMKITGVKTKNKKEAPAKKYTAEQEAQIVKLVEEGKFIEEIADALGKTVPQIRGKLLSMKITGVQTRDKKGSSGKAKIYTEEVVAKVKEMHAAGKSEEEIAEALNVNPKGLKAQMTRLGITQKAKKTKFWTDEKVAKLQDLMANSDKNVAEIADELGTKYPLICKKCKELGIDYSDRKPKQEKSA